MVVKIKSALIDFFLFFLLFSLLVFPGCKKAPPPPTEDTSIQTNALGMPLEIDVQEIVSSLKLPFRVLKADTVGYAPLHRFYWLCLEEEAPRDQIRVLAQKIVQEIITNKPNTYHSITIHFFIEADIAEKGIRNDNRFACATFLPKGSWLEVGRTPIDGYKDYRLTCDFFKD